MVFRLSSMKLIYSFAPIVDRHARVLILGSMPGQASLSAQQYYAHPKNAFWRIMGDLLQFDPAVASYAAKTNALKSERIALWDVLQSCKRQGSLDSNIETQSQTANDFQSFFKIYQHIRYVFFNGGKAESCFKQYVLRDHDLDFMQLARLPSTSPAYATLSYVHKRDQWREMLGSVIQP